MNIRTRGIQIQIFTTVLAKQNTLESGWSHHQVAILRSPGLSIRFSRFASTCAEPRRVPQPLRARAEPRPSQTLARLLTAQCRLAALPLWLPNISGFWGRQWATKPWSASEPAAGYIFFLPDTGLLHPGRSPWGHPGPDAVWGKWGRCRDGVGVGRRRSAHRTRLRGGAGPEGKPRPA